MNTCQKEHFEYPFGKKGVYISGVMSGISIVFAITLLRDDISALLLYFAFTSILVVVFFALKFYLYSERIKGTLESGKEEPKKHRTLHLILLILIVTAVLLSPLIFSYTLDPVWWIISISGFVPGVSIPEILLFLYARRTRK